MPGDDFGTKAWEVSGLEMVASGFPLCVENESFQARCFSLKRFFGPSVSVQRASGLLNMKPRKVRPQEAPAPPATPTRRRRERLGDKETGGHSTTGPGISCLWLGRIGVTGFVTVWIGDPMERRRVVGPPATAQQPSTTANHRNLPPARSFTPHLLPARY